ncbi:MAG: hypothetical protein JWR77_517 [Rhizorhabdus sp.]|nr:hypothetical protein [Rhizorhabdus sp.]
MSTENECPVLYFNQQCPFCLKVRIFLLESGLRSAVDVREFAPGSPGEAAIRAELAPHFEKVTFPTARFGTEYVNDSDAIIARLAASADVDPAALPVLASYKEVALGRVIQLFRENAELKQKLG